MGLFQIDISKRGLYGETFALWDRLSDLWLPFCPVEVPYWWVEADLRSCKGLGFDALITLAVLGKLDGHASSFARNFDFSDSSPLSLHIFGQILNPSDVLDILNPRHW